MTPIRRLIATSVVASVAMAATAACAADKLKLAVGQCGNWDSSPVELGIRTGAYAKHELEIEALCTQGTGETQQAVIAGSADIGIGVGTLGALGAFAKGAPIRIVSGSATGNADFWIVKAESPLKSVADATSANTVAYSTNGSSTHSVVLGLIKELGLKAKPTATGGPAATITLMMSGQVDIGWSSPPLGFDLLDQGKIRIFARANDVPSLRGQTVRVNIANADSSRRAAPCMHALSGRFARRSIGCTRIPRRSTCMPIIARPRSPTPSVCATSSSRNPRSTSTPSKAWTSSWSRR